MIQRPLNAYYDKTNRISKLKFPDGENGEYLMRGGICWPVYDPTQGSIEGFALLAGQNIRSKIITVFEQTNFVSVDHVLGKDGFVEYTGLCSFFNMCWTSYFANSYFIACQQGVDLNHRYRLQVLRSNMTEPKPALIEVNIFSASQASQLIFEKIAQKTLRHKSEDRLHVALTTFSIDSERMTPAIQALATCLFGIEQMPYRERRMELPSR